MAGLGPGGASRSLFSPRTHRHGLLAGVRREVRGIKRRLGEEPWRGEEPEYSGELGDGGAGALGHGGARPMGPGAGPGPSRVRGEAAPPAASPVLAVTEVPPRLRALFAPLTHFNEMQSAALPALLHSDATVVVTAPTGSGKTVLFELAIARLLASCVRAGAARALYLAPVKALCAERFRDWGERVELAGLRVTMMTGDSDTAEVPVGLTIATPEKWDAVSRRVRAPQLALVMVDEAHLLNDSSRGHVLEAVLTRIKVTDSAARFVAVSATFPNIEDMALWLGGPEARVFKVTRGNLAWRSIVAEAAGEVT